MDTIISVIIPVYNGEKFIGECLDSILAQSCADFEIIAVNDGSSDTTWSILEEYAKRDARIKPISQENSGVSSARNFGISVATGKYICFVDADDMLEVDFLKKFINIADKEKCDVVFGGYKFLYGTLKNEKQPRIASGRYSPDDLKNRLIDDGTLSGILFGSACGCLYNAAVIKKYSLVFNRAITLNEDGLFNIQFLKYASSLYVSDSSDYLYRQWKISLRPKKFVWKSGLDDATEAIKQVSDIPLDDIQFKRRDLSVYYWNMLSYAETGVSLAKIINAMKIIDVSEYDFSVLDYANMNIGKKFTVKLLQKRKFILFVAVTRYVKPFLQKIMKH